MQWVKQDATPEQLAADNADCRQSAWREAQLRGWLYRPIGPTTFRDASGRTLVYWPYGPFSRPFEDSYFEELRLASFCMRSKGYELQPVEKKAEAEERK